MDDTELGLVEKRNRPIKKTVVISVIFSYIWFTFEMILWLSLGVYHSSYYSYGPSKDLILPFTNIVIDTWIKWIALIIHTFASNIIETIIGDMVYPWITSVVLNPEVPLYHNNRNTIIIVNLFFTVKSLSTLLFFMISFAQFDIAFTAVLSQLLAGLYSTTKVVNMPSRRATLPSEPLNNIT